MCSLHPVCPLSHNQATRYLRTKTSCKNIKVADACARSCMNNDAKQFWNNVSKMANKNATARVNKIGDSVGKSEICNMWHNYFQNL